MKKYFYSDGANNFGPFTIEELKEKGITRETNVWFHELGEWKKAGTVKELNELFAFIPPPIHQDVNYSQMPISEHSRVSTLDIVVFISIVFWFITNFADFIISRVVDDWWSYNIFKYVRIVPQIVLSAIPFVLALSVKNKTLRIGAIIIGTLLSIKLLYDNINWLILALKY